MAAGHSFVHGSSGARIGIQLGHSGRKGATKLMWEGMDEPLTTGTWPVCGPSPLPYAPGLSQMPRELTVAEMRQILAQFVASGAGRRPGRVRPARAALRARVPAVVVHLAGVESADGRVRRLAGWAAAVSAGGVRRGALGVAGAQAHDRADLGVRLGAGRHHRSRGRDDRRRVRGRGRGRHRRVDGPGDARTSSQPSAGRTRPRSRTRSGTR